MEPVANQVNAKSTHEIQSVAWLTVAAAALRTAFGILMAIDAYLKWQPGFAAHYVGYLQNAANAQPHWLQGWFHMWLRLVTMHTAFFISATRLIENGNCYWSSARFRAPHYLLRWRAVQSPD